MQAINCSSFAFLESRLSSAFVCFLWDASSGTPVYKFRNWLLDAKFKLKDGSDVNKNPLQALISLTNTEVNVCWKINQKHLDVERTNRQNVRLPAQLLSNNLSTALLHDKPGENKQMAANLGHLISDINIWFDICYVPKGSVPSKNAYGIDLENQNEHLKNVYDLISTMRVNGKNPY
jgi:hypothetical protein